MSSTIKLVVQVVLLFVSRWLEIDKDKRAKRKELVKEARDATKITNPKLKASRLNDVVRRAKHV